MRFAVMNLTKTKYRPVGGPERHEDNLGTSQCHDKQVYFQGCRGVRWCSQEGPLKDHYCPYGNLFGIFFIS